MTGWRLWLRGSLALGAGLALAGPAAARTWMVDDDRAECPRPDFTTIAAAVTAAASGDTIRLCPGFYRENITVSNKSLAFQGDGTERVIVDGNLQQPLGSAPSNLNVFTLQATNGLAYTCRFQDLTLRRGRYGILAQDTETGGGRPGSQMTLDVSRCLFVHNGYDGIPYASGTAGYTTHATDGGGVRGEGDDSRVADCRFEANDRAIQFDAGARLQVTGNQISGNLQAGISLGLRRQGNAGPAVTDVTVSGNQVSNNYDAGIRISGGLRVTVQGNDISRNWDSGLVAFDADTLTVRQNRIVENSLMDTNGLDSLTPDSLGGLAVIDALGTVTISGNEIQANHQGLFTQTAGGVRLIQSRNVPLTVTGNTIFANDGDGVVIDGGGLGVRITGNNLTGNRGFGVNNLTTALIDATGNWWASATGPRTGAATADNPEQVSGRLVVRPWATAPVAYPDIRLAPMP
jgi:parallel beta-helix repeat protein